MGENLSIIDVLKNTKFFSALDAETFTLLCEKMNLEKFSAGEVICNEGDMGNRMFVIKSGSISVEKKGEDGQPVEITKLEPGSVAGELSLFEERPRSATLKAREETELWTLGHDTFRELLNENVPLLRSMLETLSSHLCRETSVVAKLLTSNIDNRFKVAFFDSKPYMKQAFDKSNKYNYSINYLESRLSPETVSLAAGSDAVCVFVNDNLNGDVIEELSAMGIKKIALRCAGFNNVDLDACEKHGISVTRVSAYSPYAVAEHAVALIMSLNRQTHRANNRVREGNFSLTGLIGFDLHEKTVGVIGIGKIGKCFLDIVNGFGCKLLAHTRTPKPELTEEMGVQFVELDELLEKSDIISLHTPLTPETQHLINKETIEKMKDGVMLINTGRGGLIDTEAMIDGLKNGKIGYAGLDVYERESNYFFEDLSDSVMSDDTLARLTTFNNVIVTSHQAFLTWEALGNIADTTIENLREYEEGKQGAELTNCVSG
ncbi:MAG: D-lactate dehydrogenase family protein [Planctomycetota bacterium]|jgi:D-lactate dehydrogenase